MNIATILKMLGVKISDEDIEKLQNLIPQIPALVNQSVGVINMALANFDGRLQNLEKSHVELHRKLDLILEGVNVNPAQPRRLAAGDGNDRINGAASNGAD